MTFSVEGKAKAEALLQALFGNYILERRKSDVASVEAFGEREWRIAYPDLTLPSDLSLAAVLEASAMVGRWERNEAEFKDAWNGVPLVLTLWGS